MKSQCTDGSERRLSRWEHEDVLERAQARLDEYPDAMQLRRSRQESAKSEHIKEQKSLSARKYWQLLHSLGRKPTSLPQS
jgi:hypothetical protein